MRKLAGISTSIELQDRFSSVLNNVCNAVNLAISSMADMQSTMAADVDTSSLENAREQINLATLAIHEMNEAMQNTGAPQIETPSTPVTTPESAPIPAPAPVSSPVSVQAPVQWQTDNLPVFDGSGMERFRQEAQSADAMLQQLCRTQDAIARQALHTNALSPEAFGDINNLAVRMDSLRNRIQAISENPVNMGTEQANSQLEQLRAQLNAAIQQQEELNGAMASGDISAINEAYLRLSQTVGNTERYIRDNTDEQGRFNQQIRDGTSASTDLVNSIKGAVSAYVGVQGVKKAFSLVQDCTDAFNTQLNAENQLMAVLGNMLDEDYVAQFELETTADTTAAVDEINAIQNSVDEVVVSVTAETRALNASFDQITAKASEIQGRGIYGDEAMIAAAAEFSTYFTDTSAIEMMMDTLANYAMGMSGGGEIDSNGMVNYATNLGKIMSGAYDAMTKKGFEFTDAQKSIIEGEATREQIVSALGEEYLDMSSDMQAAAAITQVIDESWAGLYESMSNTPEGKIIQMTNAWGDMKEVIGGQLYPYVLLFVDAITENWGTIQSVVDGITIGLKCMLGFFAWLVEGAINFAQVVIDNWSWIGPIIGGVVAILATYALYLGIVKGIEIASVAASGAMAVAKGIQATAIWLTTSATWAETTAQLGLNGAMYACPVVWIIGLIIALIAIFYAAVAIVNKFAGTSVSATGIICGVFMVAAAFIGNQVVTLINFVIDIFVTLWNFIAAFVNFFGNVFNDPVGAIARLFFDLADVVLGILEALASAIDTLFGSNLAGAVSGWRSNLGSWVDSTFGQGTEIMSKMDAGSLHLGRFEYGAAYNAGYNFGQGVDNEISGMLNKTNSAGEQQNAIGTYTGDDAASQAANAGQTAANTGQTAANTGQTADNTAKIADSLDISNQELKYLRDIAERKVVDRYATTNIKIEMTNNNNVSSDTDLDGFVNGLTAAVSDAMMKSAEGVHI